MKSTVVSTVPKGTFKGRNFLTPELVEYRKLHNRDEYVEISTATHKLSKLNFYYGVTFSGNHSHLNQLVDTYEEALELIESI
jgi:hypothetical protein